MKIESSKDLDLAIEALESRKSLQEQMLSDQFHSTVDYFKPVNLIKHAVKKVANSTDVPGMVLKAASGLGAGLLAKNVLLGKSTSFLGKLAGNAVKVGATNTVLHNTDKITAWGTAIYNNLFKKKDHHEEE